MDKLRGIKTIADLGCGIGYSSWALKGIFPQATVWGTNYPGSDHFAYSVRLGAKKGFQVYEEIPEGAGKIDFLFASEFFEHLREPFHYLRRFIQNHKPKFCYIANAFNTISVGHFIEYRDGPDLISQESASRYFNQILKDAGYSKLKTNLWNNRPSLWQRGD